MIQSRQIGAGNEPNKIFTVLSVDFLVNFGNLKTLLFPLQNFGDYFLAFAVTFWYAFDFNENGYLRILLELVPYPNLPREHMCFPDGLLLQFLLFSQIFIIIVKFVVVVLVQLNFVILFRCPVNSVIVILATHLV
jgi:hypothetical protein